MRHCVIDRTYVVALLLSLLVAASWGGAPPAAAQTAAPATQIPRPVTAMRFTLQPNLNAVNFWIALEKGYFKDNGIDATIFPVDIGFNGVQLAVAGQSQAGGSSVYPMLNIFAQGGNQVVPAIYAVVNIQKIVVRKGIQKPADLIGKKVAITAGSIFAYSFVRYLEQHNVDPKSVNIVAVAAPEQAAAIRRGDVDALVNVDPTATQALTALGADGQLLQPKMEFRDRVFLQMNRSWVLANREAAVGMLRALVQASRFLKSNPQEGYAIVAKQLSLTPQQVQDQIGQGWEFDVTLGQDAVDEAVTVAKFMVDRGILKQAVDARGLFDPSLLKTVDPALVTVR